MKKFTLMMIALLTAVVTFAAGPKKQLEALPFAPAKANVQLGKQFNAKQAPATVAKKMQKAAKTKARAPKKAVAAADLAGDYTWDYLTTSDDASTDLESLTTTAGSAHVTIAESATTEGGITISGMFTNALEAAVVNADGYDYFQIEAGQLAGTSSYGDYALYGLFYYEGDDENEAGWYYDDIYGFLEEDGSITIDNWLVRVLSGGNYDGYSLSPYWVGGSTLTPSEPLTAVDLPEGVEAEEYVMTYTDYYDKDASASVMIGFDGNDVYFQGINSYLPEAWVKGTLAEGVVTLAGGQYFGAYGSYEMYLQDEDYQFAYDAEANVLTGNGVLYTYTGNSYTDYYSNPVLKKVVEKAAMPANPAISALTNSNYGWYVSFSVPTVDVNGDGMATSKLSYMIYTDIEGEIAPLTFTPETHTLLTEAMTEIPYGFTEGYDFYDTAIYFNDLYSADWNNLGIQSIYRGGDEENATEIQWYHIKDYAEPVVPTESFVWVAGEQGYENAQDVTEFVITDEEGATIVSGVVAQNEATNSPKYYTTGEALRLYAGNTLTLTSKNEEPLVKIEFTMTGTAKQMSLEADKGEYSLDSQAGVGTWTGEETEVVFTVPNASGSQARIQKIEVFYEGEEPGPGPVEPEEAIDPDGMTFNFEDGSMQGWTTIDADGDGFTWKLGASPSINTVNDSEYSVYSESYDLDTQKALTPDNYLVSPKIKLGCPITFYACAQDGSYPAEHFGVAVSTNGKTDAADFTTVEEWTLTASRVDNPRLSRGSFRSPRKAPGAWYKYTVDLSEYEGQEGYVAIRHFDCTDFFYIVVDDITFGTPEYTITPEESKMESLGEFTLTFNKYDIVVSADAAATLTNTTTGTTVTGTITVEGNTLTISFDETVEPGVYTLTITGVKSAAGEDIDLSFSYTIEAAPEPAELVELPEGVEPEEFTLTASGAVNGYLGWEASSVEETRLVAFDGSDVYVQGLAAQYFPEGYVKGTLNADGQYVFQSGQLVGEDEYGPEYLIGFNADMEIIDFVFDFDAESRTLTLADGIYVGESAAQGETQLYAYLETAVYTEGGLVLPDLVELPEGVESEAWTLEGFYNQGGSGNDVQRAIQVAFDGADVYVQGLAYWMEEAWLKGTLDTETGIVTFPAGQFIGRDEYGMEFMLGFDGEMCDIQYAYDAEAKTLTQVTPYVLESQTETGYDEEGEITYWGFWEASYLYAGEPNVIETVEAPEGLETETYLFSAMQYVEDESYEARKIRKIEGDEEEDATTVTFDFNAMDVVTSSNDSSDGDITETLQLAVEDMVTLTISPAEEGATTPNRFWSSNNGPQLRVYSGTLTFSVPEGATITKMVFNAGKWNAGNAADSGEFDGATWTGEAQTVVVTIAGNTQINNIEVTVEGEGGEEPGPDEPEVTMEPYMYQTQVGFDGNKVYFKGFSENTAEMWAMGTMSEDGKTVTIPANQYMGFIASLFSIYDFYITAVSEDLDGIEDIVLNYDAETATFTTNQTIMLNGSKHVLYPYQTFTEVVITKMEEFAATPADPEIVEYAPEANFPRIDFNIPAEDVDGNILIESKLAYQIFVVKDDVIQPLTLEAALYKYLEEDMTETPYSFDDSYDIYKGGSRVYLNQGAEEIASWTNIGVQSIYYGGGECNKSETVWLYPEDPIITGIAGVKTDSKSNVIFDLQGRRVAKATKGLYIMDGKKVVMK